MAAIRGTAIALGFVLLLWTVAAQGGETINRAYDGIDAIPGEEKFEASAGLESRGNEEPIHLPGELIPPVRSEEDRGWRKLEDIKISRNEMYKVNDLNEPHSAIDRRNGQIDIDGAERYRGAHNETGGGSAFLYARRDGADEAPDVALSRDGSGRVKFQNGCVVYYKKGHRKEETRECSGSQVRRADDLMAEYRRKQDRDRDYSGHRGDYSTPKVSMSSDGSGRVIFKNNCTVYYDARGHRIRELPECSESQVRRADDAMVKYRHENQIGGGN